MSKASKVENEVIFRARETGSSEIPGYCAAFPNAMHAHVRTRLPWRARSRFSACACIGNHNAVVCLRLMRMRKSLTASASSIQ